MTTTRRQFIFGSAALLTGALAGRAWAHARLLKSTPANKVKLKEAPRKVELWFNELLDSRFNKIEVFAAADLNQKDRRNYVKGDPEVDPKDRTRLFADLQPLAPGEYMIEYRVLSRDGHTAPGRLTFAVLPPP